MSELGQLLDHKQTTRAVKDHKKIFLLRQREWADGTLYSGRPPRFFLRCGHDGLVWDPHAQCSVKGLRPMGTRGQSTAPQARCRAARATDFSGRAVAVAWARGIRFLYHQRSLKESIMTTHHDRFVSYLRVSTEQQGKSGLGIDAQRQAIADYLNGSHWTLAAEFVETESGKHADRPQLQMLHCSVRKHKARLIIAKLDRLSRNVAFVATMMDLQRRIPCVRLPSSQPVDAPHPRAAVGARTR